MDNVNCKCPKCGGIGADVDQFQATGGNVAKILDIQNKKFTTVSCKNCGYTELYRGDTKTVMNVLDLFFGG
jgi:predicted nucleic-acid-binding Zn-ribbon protein